MTTTNSRAGFRTNHARTGFTILELLIVITIMLAVTAMAIPLLAPSREDRRVNEASRIITSMFAGARS
ncbi:MAG: Tfp pilus assembly protein FimT/FimU, partial [Pirellulales bacterium]